MIVKVCGMREASNIREVDNLPTVDWMGFIFYPRSPRHVADKPCYLPQHSKRVGVFVNAENFYIDMQMKLFGLDMVQLHGQETPADIKELRSILPPDTGIIKTIAISTPADLTQAYAYDGVADYLLFETKCSGYGGSGKQFDWSILQDYKGHTPFLLTGGISPDDAPQVRAFHHPLFAGIDLNSRFETAPAIKDAQSIKTFTESIIQTHINTMNRINALFSTKDKDILSIYFCAGHPTLGGTANVIKTLEQKGVDMIEIGIPFSDPMADGPVIQDAATKALRNGMSLRTLFSQLENIRKEVSIPLILMGYLNPIMQYDFEAFCQRCKEIGIDGVIIPDLPFKDYLEDYKPVADRYDIRVIMLITPETSEERVRFIDDNTDGFIYMVSSAATTGAQKEFDEAKQRYFSRINNMGLKHPRMIGFGISNKQTLESANANASGAIIGSKFVSLLEKTGNASDAMDELLEALKH